MTRTNLESPRLSQLELYATARRLRAEAIGKAVRAAASGLKGWVKRHLVDPARSRALRQRQFGELTGMDEHMLRDLGISRGNIAYAFEHGRDDVPVPANVNQPERKATQAA